MELTFPQFISLFIIVVEFSAWVAGPFATIYYLGKWIYYRWMFVVLVASGRETYYSFVVLPALSSFAGATSAIGLEHILSDDPKLTDWYLLGAGVFFLMAAGTWILKPLRRRPMITVGLVSGALHKGRNVDSALEALERLTSDEEIEKWKPLAIWLLTLPVALVFMIANFIAHVGPKYTWGLIIALLSGFVLTAPVDLDRTIRRSTRPILLDFARQIRDKQRQLNLTSNLGDESNNIILERVDYRLAALLLGTGALAAVLTRRNRYNRQDL